MKGNVQNCSNVQKLHIVEKISIRLFILGMKTSCSDHL